MCDYCTFISTSRVFARRGIALFGDMMRDPFSNEKDWLKLTEIKIILILIDLLKTLEISIFTHYVLNRIELVRFWIAVLAKLIMKHRIVFLTEFSWLGILACGFIHPFHLDKVEHSPASESRCNYFGFAIAFPSSFVETLNLVNKSWIQVSFTLSSLENKHRFVALRSCVLIKQYLGASTLRDHDSSFLCQKFKCL